MKKNKTLSLCLTIGAAVSALIAIFMGLVPAIVYKRDGNKGDVIKKWFDYIFKTGDFKEIAGSLHYNGIYIVGFILLILAVCALAALIVLKLTNKGSNQIQLALVITAMAGLLIAAIFALCAKAVYAGEMYKNANEYVTPEMIKEELKYIHLGAGPIIAGVFGILGGGCALFAHLTKE